MDLPLCGLQMELDGRVFLIRMGKKMIKNLTFSDVQKVQAVQTALSVIWRYFKNI